MDLKARKLSFIQEVLKIQNEEIITGLENLLRNKKNELFNESLKPMSLDDFNSQIDEALSDVKNNNLKDAGTLKAEMKEW